MIYRFGECELDVGRLELRRGGVVGSIEPQVFELVRYLVERHERFVAKDELHEAIWHGRLVSEAALSSRIRAARRALGDSGAEQRIIRTIHGRGFRLVAPVTMVADEQAASAKAPSSGEELAVPKVERSPQEIRYCTTHDGVRLAYALSGSGPALVKTTSWLNHLDFDWASPLWRPWLDMLSPGRCLVRYDGRGNGLSDWSVDDISVDGFVSDLEAVVAASGLERFALLGISQGAAIAIAYAVRHPEKISQLVVYNGYVRGWRNRGSPEEIKRREAMTTLIAEGWGHDNPAFRQIFTSLFIPGGTAEQVEWFNNLMRVATSPANAARLHEAFGEVEVGDLLEKVRAPTLVFHGRNDAVVPFEEGRAIAAGIPGARFVPLESFNHVMIPTEPAWPRLVQEMNGFLPRSC